MHFNIYVVFYSQFFHQRVPGVIAVIFSVTLLQKYKCTNVVNCVDVTP